MGYYVECISPPAADGGFDVIAHADALGIKGPRIKVQVKRCADKLNVRASSIHGSLERL